MSVQVGDSSVNVPAGVVPSDSYMFTVIGVVGIVAPVPRSSHVLETSRHPRLIVFVMVPIAPVAGVVPSVTISCLFVGLYVGVHPGTVTSEK